MGRASLNWSIDRLAEESGVHRNTISNFELGKFSASAPETLSSIRTALESAGVIFGDSKTEGVQMRRFQRGDLVRLRRGSRIGLNYIPALKENDVGEIIDVEPHPPQTGPTYRAWAKFSGDRVVHGVFKSEFELVRAVEKAKR